MSCFQRQLRKGERATIWRVNLPKCDARVLSPRERNTPVNVACWQSVQVTPASNARGLGGRYSPGPFVAFCLIGCSREHVAIRRRHHRRRHRGVGCGRVAAEGRDAGGLPGPRRYPHHKVGESLDWSSPGLLRRLGIDTDALIADGIATYKKNIVVCEIGQDGVDAPRRRRSSADRRCASRR